MWGRDAGAEWKDVQPIVSGSAIPAEGPPRMLAGRMAGQATPTVLTVLLTLALYRLQRRRTEPRAPAPTAPAPASRHYTATARRRSGVPGRVWR